MNPLPDEVGEVSPSRRLSPSARGDGGGKLMTDPSGASRPLPALACREEGLVPSVRLDRQRLRLRPLAHGGIVERDVVVAKLVQQEQVDRGRDAAAAIADR